MSVRVVARIRPLLEAELDKDIIVRADSAEAGKPDTIVKVPNPKNNGEEFSFTFNAVYDQSISQEGLFTSEGTGDPLAVATRRMLQTFANPHQSPRISSRCSRATMSPSLRTASPARARRTPCEEG